MGIREDAYNAFMSRVNKNKYSQARPGNFWGKNGGTGSGDCSLTIKEVIQKVTGVNIGGNTSAQVKNVYDGRHGKIVMEKGNAKYPDYSQVPNMSAIYFKGNSSHYKGVGHVEFYFDGKLGGHGSGTGPTIKNNPNSYIQRRGTNRGWFVVVDFLGDGTVTPPKLGDRLLKFGMSGLDVKELQTYLKELGFFGGQLGGNYLAITESAVKAFQKDQGLSVDGKFGPKSFEALQAVLKSGGIAPGKPILQQMVRVVDAKSINVRMQPSTKHTSKVIGWAFKGDEMLVIDIDQASGWFKVETENGLIGWVSPKYTVII